jgi:N-acetyl-anhydromuramyl-L-alanine amidase AmpD
VIHDVRNQSDPFWFAYPLLSPASVQYVFVHRISLSQIAYGNPHPIADDLLTGPELARRFLVSEALGTGQRIPYHLLVRRDGDVDQMISLGRRGAHARGKNWCSWAVAIAGNTDEAPVSVKQWDALIDVLWLLAGLHPELQIVGHTEIPGTSGDPNKQCPGRHISMDSVRKAVADRTVGDPNKAIDLAVSARLILR